MPNIGNLMRRLEKREPVPAIVLLGADSYLRDMCRDAIIKAFVEEGAREWALFRFSVRDSGWDSLFDRAQTVPMLSSCQVLIVEEVDSIERLGDESRDEIAKSLGSYLSSPAPFTVLVLEAETLDKRQKFARLLADKALVVELSIGGESAAALAVQMAKKSGAEIDRAAAALLADILNSEPARMSIEIEKLAAYVGAGGHITAKNVEELVVAARRNTVWQLADMIASRKRDSALAFLDNLLRGGEQMPAIVGALAWMYRKLIEARELPASANAYQAARTLGMRPETAEIALRQARRIAKKDLLAGLAALAEADSELKSGNPNPRAALEFLIARLTSPAASAAAGR
ncbi:MAG TPA: DNA polymerase III subunit delta [Candidatus Acidoferrales bacterium]|nr:DNA polymerase III subunit delta [Candidatus Acidoferrales bacterium]